MESAIMIASKFNGVAQIDISHPEEGFFTILRVGPAAIILEGASSDRQIPLKPSAPTLSSTRLFIKQASIAIQAKFILWNERVEEGLMEGSYCLTTDQKRSMSAWPRTLPHKLIKDYSHKERSEESSEHLFLVFLMGLATNPEFLVDT